MNIIKTATSIIIALTIIVTILTAMSALLIYNLNTLAITDIPLTIHNAAAGAQIIFITAGLISVSVYNALKQAHKQK